MSKYYKNYENYLASDVWKCLDSPTNAHHWIGNANKMHCIYCPKEQDVEHRTIIQVHLKEMRDAKSNKKLQHI